MGRRTAPTPFLYTKEKLKRIAKTRSYLWCEKTLKTIKRMVKKLILFAILLFVVACTGNKSDYSQLKERLDSLQKGNNRKDKDINDMTTYVSLLADGLDSIAKQEEML